MPAAGRSSISAHRRSLMTATAAGAVLCALWFVPTAKATPEAPGGAHHAVTSGQGAAQGAARGTASGPGAAERPATGSEGGTVRTPTAAADTADDGLTSPFVLSSLGLAGTGAVLIVRARRRVSGGGPSV